ncbi:MAG: hypothetical protein M1290_01495 [Candidatus Thermoplasmatota archaeon]|jgi:O-antigen/teichoic acid export membrane protein|nr:hypothetical protein [Candidatus Thermoplasmatota archaeon]MCL5789123.1 hypothetical protein [Candidatus Thermoplasmatota archaeon]
MSEGSVFPIRPPSPRGKSRLKIFAIAIVVIVIASAVVVVAYPPVAHYLTSSRPLTPVFAFLPSSVLNSTYEAGFTAYNHSENLSTSSIYSTGNIVKGEFWIYSEGNSTNTTGTVAILILRMNSTSAASLFVSNFIKGVESSPKLFLNVTMTNGTFDNFLYSTYTASDSNATLAQVFIAHDGEFVLLMEFLNLVVLAKDLAAFHDQVKLMFH